MDSGFFVFKQYQIIQLLATRKEKFGALGNWEPFYFFRTGAQFIRIIKIYFDGAKRFIGLLTGVY